MKKQISQAIIQTVVDKAISALGPPSSSKQPSNNRRKTTNRRRKRKPGTNIISGNGSSLSVRPSANTLGYVLGSNRFGYAGQAQRLADIDPRGSQRVEGTCLLLATAYGNTINAKGLAYDGSTYYWMPLTSSYIDYRLYALFQIYDLYVFRYLKLTYVPGCSSANSKTIAFGVTSAYVNVVDDVTPLQSDILEIDSSVLTTVWNTASIELRNTGMKTYFTSTNAANGPSDRIQCMLGAAYNGVSGANTDYGQFMIEYVIDLYTPSMHKSGVGAMREERDQFNLKEPAVDDSGEHEVDDDPVMYGPEKPPNQSVSRSSSRASKKT